ncbi:MAG: phosphotransferase family protein [Gammaproteobacteria bacterium]|nr:phosphotransferase family protein [Gammaproteobacteria bacterium]NNF48720.1 phosphotransferase family protein [Woeseiaceae bacterium]MBT8093683.1 phosphotransferase family protein [Gammaproteobacteria bacterium]MBT8104027.1 phosphotransferase family protein [Gammaproteobacteria bacterium]NNK24042.1 phosphotransferase family protein [Woeseiaceae bacterium]
MDVNIAGVLRGIPGWEDARFEALPGGHTNHTWLLTAGERKAVLKIDPTPRSAPYNTRTREATMQSLAADCGLAGRVLFTSDTIYLSEYLEGEVWTVGSFADNENIERLAEALRRLHSLPQTGRTFDALSAARDYASCIVNPDEARVTACLQTIAAEAPGPSVCFCHNDLVVDNIVSVPETRFLDWEYACDNDPFFDLATITTHHGLTEEKAEVLLDAYFDGDGERHREHLARQAGVYSALLYLWERSRNVTWQSL